MQTQVRLRATSFTFLLPSLRYRCGECGKNYATSSNLSRHKQVRTSSIIKTSYFKFPLADSQNAGFKQCKEVHGLWENVRQHAGPVDARAHPQPLPQVQVGDPRPRKPLAGFAARHSLGHGSSRDTSDPTLGTNPLDVLTVESPLQIGDLPICTHHLL